MSMSTAPSSLGALLKELFRRKKWQQRFDQHALFLGWQELVGTEIAERAQPDSIRGDVLWLRVADSVWMQQLSLQKSALLNLLNARLGEKGIKDIRFRLDVTLSNRRSLVPASRKQEQERPLSAKESQEFEEMALPLKDEELKTAMRRLWLLSRRHRGGGHGR